MKKMFPPATKKACILFAISLIVFIIMVSNDHGTIGVPAIDLLFLFCLLLEIILVTVGIIYSIVALIKEKTLFSGICLFLFLYFIIAAISM